MYPILALALSALLILLMDGVAAQNRDLARLYQSRIRQMQVVSLAESIAQYHIETGSVPPDMAALSATPGFQHVKGLFDNWQGYAVSPVLNDGVWRFRRAVLFSNDPSKGTTVSDYLAANACGTGGFDTALSWCGSKDSRWFRIETREMYNAMIETQRARMARLLQKFSDYYNANGTFPDKDNGGANLGAGSMTKVASLAGYAGSAGNCSGVFTYMGVPIDCGDMFDLWGNPVGYQFVSGKHVVLVSETPIYNNEGHRVVVAAEYDFSLM